MAMPTVTAAGLRIPDYAEFLMDLKTEYRAIYGADVYLDADSQDGQWLATIAQSQYDLARLAQAVYNSFSPLTAVSDALSRNVRINGIKRLVASYSTVDLVLEGTPGAVITTGKARDTAQQIWLLPTTVTIPLSGTLTVSAVAETIGQIRAAAGTIKTIATPQRGWLSVSNTLSAVPGEPIETDAQLRARQRHSVALPSLSVLDGIVGALFGLTNVTRVRAYENDTGVTDINGVPGHSLAMVVEGGDAQAIGDAIRLRKTPGTGTYGDVAIIALDAKGVPATIRFFRPAPVTIKVQIQIQILNGYQSTTATLIRNAIANYLRARDFGARIAVAQLYCSATVAQPAGGTYIIRSLLMRRSTDPDFSEEDIDLAFTEVATATGNDVAVLIL